MRILFFGTPAISARFLKALLASEQVAGVVTMPDKQRGRGHKVQPPEVKIVAQENNIPVFQPEKFNDDDIKQLESLKPDVGVVVSYGKLIPQRIFTIPSYGCFNVHFSLLPKYRGAAPMQWALINGETITGVTTFWLEETLDSGPILIQKTIPIDAKDDAPALEQKLTDLGITAVKETLECISAGTCTGKIQKGAPTYAPILKKEMGKIDWSLPSERIVNLIRGTKSWPGAYSKIESGALSGVTIKFLSARVFDQDTTAAPGEIKEIVKGKGFVVSCGKGAVLVEEIHPENKKAVSAWPFLQSGQLKIGDKFATI